MDTHCSARCRVPRGGILTLATLFPAIAALIVAVAASRNAVTAAPGPVPRATIDPRLMVHASHVPITGSLAGVALHGMLYPGFPSKNSIELSGPLSRTAASPHGRLELAALMPGMQMVPARAQLTWRAGAYRGSIALPMFGTYTARLTLIGVGMHADGTALLTLPLSLGR